MDNQKFLIYIDESGIHKDTDHSSFVVIYVDKKDQAYLNRRVLDIEERLKISSFHWSAFSSRYKWNIRKNFIKGISQLPFAFKYTILKNPIQPKEALCDFMLKMIVETNIETIYIDGKYSKLHTQSLSKILRDRGLSTKSLKMVNDLSFPGIRIADAIAGLVRSYHDNPSKDSKQLFERIIRYKKHDPPF